MANEPYGDVEIVIPSKVDTHTAFNSKQTSSGSRAPTTKLKLRLRQDKRTLEITRHTVSGSSSHYTSSGSNGAQARDGQPGSGTLKSTVIGRGSGSQGFTPRDQDGNNVGMIVTSKKVIPVVIRAGYRMEILGEEGALDEEEVGALGLLGEFLRIMRVLERDVGGVEDCLKEMEKLSVSAGEKRGFQMHDEFENEREKRVVKARKLEEGVGGSRSELGKRPTMAAPSNRTIIAPELPMPGGLGGGVSANAVGGRACAGTTTATSRTASGDSSSSSSLALVHISSPSSSNISITAPQPNPNSYSRPAGTGLGRTALNSNSNSNTLTSRLAIPARPARFPSGSWSWRSRTSTDSSSSSSGSSKSRNTSTSTNEATSNL
ncbi:hypothetical protein BDY19DRAFT_344071 [Irpex rosettiformis]|uniref:Uncharacterized protein n=1 Tax=Irpex rosettiformis TaxID=378272 RepID=A0ACB8TX74_9APHY|nr:hypothetical protein BDY19DRAFT_344071 [Irpex rosettiformis]